MIFFESMLWVTRIKTVRVPYKLSRSEEWLCGYNMRYLGRWTLVTLEKNVPRCTSAFEPLDF